MRIFHVGYGIGDVYRGLSDSLVRRICCLLAMAILSLPVPASPVLAQSGTLEKSPAEIVKHYVRLDQKGARLDAMAFDVLGAYIDWKEEPAWSRIVIIQDVEVPDDYRQWDITTQLKVAIPVTYRVLGAVYLDTAVFMPEGTTEEVRFQVEAVRNRWRIVAPVIPPHVGLKRMLNVVRDAGIHEQDVSRRAALAALEDSLRKAK